MQQVFIFFNKIIIDLFLGAAIKRLLAKITSSELVQTLGYKTLKSPESNGIHHDNDSIVERENEAIVERENIESSASPSLSTVSSNKTDSMQSQVTSESSHQSSNQEDTKKESEASEEKVLNFF